MNSCKALLVVAFLCLSFEAVTSVTQQELDQLKMLLENFLKLPVSNATKDAINKAVQDLNGVTDQAQIKKIFVDAFEVIKNEPAIPEVVRNQFQTMIDSIDTGNTGGSNGGNTGGGQNTGNSGNKVLPNSLFLMMTYLFLAKLVRV